MSPRQRLSPNSSHEELSRVQKRASLSDDASDTSTDSAGSARLLKPSFSAESPPTAAEIAREQHDIFNIVALLFVCGASLVNWDFRKLLTGHGPAEAWTGQYFYENWATTVLYFLVDLLWVAKVPICVKSPGVIIKHHIVAILYLSAPLAWPEYRWFMGACLSVEINTWFLILRRVVYKRKEWSNIVFQEAVSLSFYLSWIAIRCFIYPGIMVIFLQMAYERVIETNKLWHWPMLFIPVHFFLCLLNLKWSYDLFLPIIKRWLSPAADAQAPTVSSGL